MLTLIASMLLAGVTYAVIYFWMGAIAAILPTVVVLVAAFILISRKISKKMEALMLEAQKEFQKNRIDRGIMILLRLKKGYSAWQFFAGSAIDGQIGSVHYLRQDFDRAKPFLERAFSRHWIAKGMLGILAFKKKDFESMDKIFSTATRYSPKQGLLWNLWAYLHWKLGHIDRAIEILNLGQKKLGESDPHLLANLSSLKNSKKMKMKGYGEQWYQFHLEVSPAVKEMQSQRVKFARR